MPNAPVHNTDRLERLIETDNLDAVIARSGRSVSYLSGLGFPGTLGRLQDFAHSPRAALVVWPTDGEPALLVSNIAEGLARRDSWIDDIRSYTEYVESPYGRAAELLAESGDETGRIGVERRELGVEHWEELQRSLPDAELVEWTDELDRVRNIKTAEELELLERAVQVQEEAHRVVFEEASAGDTERELHARMLEEMTRRGTSHVHGMLQSDNTDVIYGGERDVTLEDGDVLKTDYVCYYEGYAANLSRMAVVGEADEAVQKTYRDLYEVHRSAIENRLRPGVTAEEVYSFVESELEARGYDSIPGLVGHSIGVWWHQEEPMLVPGETRTLEADMVVCLETVIEGFWHLQDQVHLTENGPELMSDVIETDEIFRIE